MFNFKDCSDEEMFKKISTCSRQVVSYCRIRYADDTETLARILDTFEAVKKDRWKEKRGAKSLRLDAEKESRAKLMSGRDLVRRFWKNMVFRCDSGKAHPKNKYYIGCSVDFKLNDFYTWCFEQQGFGEKDEQGRLWELDKDILCPDNKVYRKDVCVFVPRDVNQFFRKFKSQRRELPVGVMRSDQGGRYRATYRKKYLGTFDTVDEACCAYNNAKKMYATELAERWGGLLDVRVYEALLNFTPQTSC